VEDIKRWNKRGLGVEKKLEVYTAGYTKVATTKESEIFKLQQQIDEAKLELNCFRAVKDMEDKALPARLQYCQEEVKKQREIESNSQQRYAELVTTKEALLAV